MATDVQVAQLRRMTAISEDDETYTGDLLGRMIDDLGSLELAASTIWGEKAAVAAGMVDMTESGSSRSFGDLYAQALAMKKAFEPVAADPDLPPSGGSFTVGMERV